MLRGALLGVLLVSAVTDAGAQERAPRAESRGSSAESRLPSAESREPSAESRSPITDSRLPIADSRTPNAEGREPRADGRLQSADNREPERLAPLDEPPPSAYDRARKDGGELPETSSLVGQLLKTMLALAFVCGIIWVIFKFGAARLLPGATGPRDGRLVRVVERVLVDQKSSLLIIDVGPDRMLLGCAEGGINLITKLGASQPPTDTTRGGPPGFRAVLDAFSPKKSSEDDNGTT